MPELLEVNECTVFALDELGSTSRLPDRRGRLRQAKKTVQFRQRSDCPKPDIAVLIKLSEEPELEVFYDPIASLSRLLYFTNRSTEVGNDPSVECLDISLVWSLVAK